MSIGSSLKAQAPNVPEDGMNTEIGGDRGSVIDMNAPNVPRTRTQAQVPGGMSMVINGADGQGRNMPVVSVVR